ncbi:hypothetical protein HYN43_002470 [Mucilaginibacter celer]|uniref:Uncharacterized protein n=1 Tax=Mucilaginibacter celer TaxID=2305508 RepID=A0A494VHL4_9SPHI|nr:hypothetical protein HYN43_002470 [Mucilaginibacter celer]
MDILMAVGQFIVNLIDQQNFKVGYNHGGIRERRNYIQPIAETKIFGVTVLMKINDHLRQQAVLIFVTYFFISTFF